jgi:cysteine-rich repeat protein
LNPTNVALDGGDAKLVGATTLALDDVMIGVPTAGETPGAFAEVALPPSFAGRTLTNIMSFPGFVVPHWATLGWESIAGRSEGSTVGCSNPTATFELGINLRARIGGVAVFACPGFPPVEEVIGVGLETESASSGGGQIVLGRSRDFTTLPEAPSCAAHQARYGAAFLPGTYVVAGARELCGDLTVALPRGCGDGALDASAEQCDDGDSIDVNLCSNSCRLAECGDGVVQEPEECEPPNVNCVGIGPCSALCSKQCRSFDVIE